MKPKPKRDNSLEHYLKLLAKSSIIVFIGLFLSKVMAYAYRIIIARYFGAEIYGLFSLALILITLFTSFASFGLIDGLIRFISFYRGKNQNDKIRYLFRYAIIFLAISSILSGLLLFALSQFISVRIFHDARLIIFLRFFSILVPLTLISNALLSVIKGYEKIGWYSFIANIIQNVTKLLVLALFIFLGFGVSAVIFSQILAVFSVLLAAYFVCRCLIVVIFQKSHINKRSKVQLKKDLFSYSWPIIFASILSSIFYWADSLSIGYFKTAFDVGLYNAAVPLLYLFNLIQEAFSQLFLPLVTKEFSKNNKSLVKELSKQVTKWVFIFSVPLFLILFVFPEQIIVLFFGQEFVLASSVLRILSIGGFLSFIVPVATSLILMAGKSKLLLTNLIFATGLNLFLNIMLIPMYGLNGAAIATSVSWTVMSLMLLIEAKKFTSIVPLKRKMLRVLLVSILPLILLLIIKYNLPLTNFSFILICIFFFLVYALLVLISGCLDRNDFAVVSSIKRKIQEAYSKA